jgi:anti-anti-sigma factor
MKMSDITRIAERRLGQIRVLDLVGPNILGESHDDSLIIGAVAQLLEAGVQRVVINLGGISHVDSAGLRMLLAARSAVAERDGHLALVGATPRVREVLSVTRLNTVFDLYETEREAIDELTKRARASRRMSDDRGN